MNELLKHKQVGRLLQLPFGKTLSLARKGKIPHIVLPNGEIRFGLHDIERIVDEGRKGQAMSDTTPEKIRPALLTIAQVREVLNVSRAAINWLVPQAPVHQGGNRELDPSGSST